MKQVFTCSIRKRGTKTVVFLLAAVLTITFLLPAASPLAMTVNRLYEDGTEGLAGAEEAGILGDTDQLPRTDGISVSTLLGLVGLAFITTGGTVFTILKKKSNDKYN